MAGGQQLQSGRDDILCQQVVERYAQCLAQSVLWILSESVLHSLPFHLNYSLYISSEFIGASALRLKAHT